VQPAGPAPGGAGGQPEPVRRGEARDVGLVHRDGRHVEPARGGQAAVADDERGGEVHDVGGELPQRGEHPPAGHAHRHRRDARQVHRRDAHDRRAAVGLRAVRAGGDDHHVVARVDEVLDHPEHRVGDAVDDGKEALGHDRDAHAENVPAAPARAPSGG
jgi:hypothetical protein